MTHVAKMITSAALAATMMMSVSVVPAFAGSPVKPLKLDGDHVEFSIDRTFLETQTGVAKVYKALQVEVSKACEDKFRRLSVHTTYVEKRCETKLLGELIKSANNEALRILHIKSTAS